MKHRNRFADPWESGSSEHLDNALSVAPARRSSIPEIAAIDDEIARELAEEAAEEEFIGGDYADDEPIGDYAEAA